MQSIKSGCGSFKHAIEAFAPDIFLTYKEFTTPPIVTSFPANKRMAAIEERMASFEDWPRRCPVRPLELARAGLYASDEIDGILDCCRCYYCHQGFCMFAKGDAPNHGCSRFIKNYQ